MSLTTAAPYFRTFSSTVSEGQRPSVKVASFVAAPETPQPILSLPYTKKDGTIVTLKVGMRVKIVTKLDKGLIGKILSFPDKGTAEVELKCPDGGTITKNKNLKSCVPA